MWAAPRWVKPLLKIPRFEGGLIAYPLTNILDPITGTLVAIDTSIGPDCAAFHLMGLPCT